MIVFYLTKATKTTTTSKMTTTTPTVETETVWCVYFIFISEPFLWNSAGAARRETKFFQRDEPGIRNVTDIR